MTVDGDQGAGQVEAALRAEVSGWRPRRVPDLVELTRPPVYAWQRPVALASALGTAGLALVLVVSMVVVLLGTANIGWAGAVKEHLTHIP